MSRLQGKPYAQKVVESLDATERTNLLGLLNGSSLTPAFRSLTNASAYITDADEGVSHISLETADGNLTGYLAYTDSYVTLFAYERNSQGIAQYEIDLDAMTIKAIDETLDIEGLRTIVTDSLKADLVGGKVPAEQLPSYVDDVVEYEDLAHFPAEGEYGKIYVAIDTGSTYRWGGTEYVQIGGSSATPMVSITWSELKALRDAGELLQGQQYRITDYGFTATGSVTSGGHVFDIIVTAEDESHLEEEAFAAHHEGDTYFANNKLEAWRIWYSLDNDTDRFEWADSTNGKGVIYRMIDEFGNDIPYDFKNCLISGYYTFHNSDGDASLVRTNTNRVFDNVMGEFIDVSTGKQKLNRNYFYNTSAAKLVVYENTFGNDCYDITCNGRDCYKNTFGDGCYSISFSGNNNYYNEFGDACNMITSSGNFYNNTFGDGCYNNSFGKNAQYNTFGSVCYSNTFGNGCSKNTFETSCSGNTLEASCINNTLGTGCESIRITGSSCSHNVFGKYCQSIKLEYGATSWNVFGEYCSSIYPGSNCEHNTFGNRCTEIRTGSNVTGCTFGTKCENVWLGAASNTLINYVQYVIVDPGVRFVRITSADDANASGSNQLQNVHIHSGIKGTDLNTPVSIVVPERGQAYSYDYYATNSVDVMI